ncbi:MAG: hypothetical protein U0T80_00870 [Flavobacteriaceae bacterium]
MKNATYNNVASNGETSSGNVFMKMMPDASELQSTQTMFYKHTVKSANLDGYLLKK